MFITDIQQHIDIGGDPRLLIDAYQAQLNDGQYIEWAADNKHHTLVQKILPYANTQQCSKALIAAVRQRDTSMMNLLIPASDVTYQEYRAMHAACFWGLPECVQLLLPVVDINVCNGEFAKSAAVNQCFDVVKMIAPHCNPNTLRSMLFKSVYANHDKKPYLDMVAFLLPLVDCVDQETVDHVIETGNVSLLRMLVPHIRSCEIKNQALYTACCCEQTHCIELLCDVAQPKEVLKRLKNQGIQSSFLEHYVNADKEKSIITKALAKACKTKPMHKERKM